MRLYVTSAVLALLFAVVAWADIAIEEKRLAEPNGSIEVSFVSGEATVESWDQNEVQVTGSLGRSTDTLEFTSENGVVVVKVQPGKGQRNIGSATLHIKAPRGNRLRVGAVSADVTVIGMGAETTVNTVSGDIRIHDVAGDANAETVSGDIDILGTVRDTATKTVSGDIRVRTFEGEAKAGSISGDIHLEGTQVKRIECDTTSGDVRFTGSIAADAKVSAKAHSGDITLALPREVSARVEAECFSGDIVNGLSDARSKHPKYGPGSSLDAQLGAGEARIELNAFSGDIRLTTL